MPPCQGHSEGSRSRLVDDFKGKDRQTDLLVEMSHGQVTSSLALVGDHLETVSR